MYIIIEVKQEISTGNKQIKKIKQQTRNKGIIVSKLEEKASKTSTEKVRVSGNLSKLF